MNNVNLCKVLQKFVAALAVAALLGWSVHESCSDSHADPPAPAVCGTDSTAPCTPAAPTLTPGCLLILWYEHFPLYPWCSQLTGN